jgi:hypothetical protein
MGAGPEATATAAAGTPRASRYHAHDVQSAHQATWDGGGPPGEESHLGDEGMAGCCTHRPHPWSGISRGNSRR